jgi:YaiO family outer membrane protein
MIHLQPLLIAAVLLSAAHAGASAAEPLEGVHAADAATPDPVEQAVSAQRVPAPRLADPADRGMIQGDAAGFRIGWSDAAPGAQGTRKRFEIGMGFSSEAPVNNFMNWDSAYFRGPDRTAKFNTAFELPRETLRPGVGDGNAPFASCCRRSDTLAAPGQLADAGAAAPTSTTIYIFAIVRKKGWDFDFKDGWKLLAGSRSRDYSLVLHTKVGFITMERLWEGFRASYSFQVERSAGYSLAPSQAVQLDYLYSPRDSIGVSYAGGRELADFGTLGIMNSEVRNVGLRGQHWFTKEWAFTYQAGHSDHGSMPAFETVQLGARRSF